MKQIIHIGLLAFYIIIFSSGPGISEQNIGRETIELYGGEKDGPVKFAHHKHQVRIPDCKTCHSFFEQKKGAIEAAKKTGAMAPKKVMNKSCVKCHRTKKADGSRIGPWKCKECHIKPKT